MRIVADTNTVLSGLLWRGNPREVLEFARTGEIILCTSRELLAELEHVLSREKFTERLSRAGVQSQDLVFGYAALAYLVKAPHIPPVVMRDPDDDMVLACAQACQAERIVSGDSDLLTLREYRRIPIITATDLLREIRRKRKNVT